MNIFLLESHQRLNSECARLTRAQSQHAQKILKAAVGDQIRIGLINGNLGTATITSQAEETTIAINALDQAPPPVRPITLVLALPRPQMIKRILQTVACLGVQKLCLIQTAKVEKSFWQSPSVTEEEIHKQLLCGLEQGVATQLPIVEKYPRFRPFAEDSLSGLSEGKNQYIAHPGPYENCPRLGNDVASIFAIGPEGGFTEKEVAYFTDCNFTPVSMGGRILKVETAVTAVLATLYGV
ncbi:16S rRNA (uracil(1498)-N(3))-methyltransferase [Teredinibacter franksiae]|uniref:16S rRNA (uracil(1498)-N(3))-methyltransferase n=1 Tax=Teredinibacter franksiae TaxID=2761453 RepID=UPI001628F426|nr:16S rRNA (uracil(1498)-N(3))-methyltransferase [Teredinibacter franksiae]